MLGPGLVQGIRVVRASDNAIVYSDSVTTNANFTMYNLPLQGIAGYPVNVDTSINAAVVRLGPPGCHLARPSRHTNRPALPCPAPPLLGPSRLGPQVVLSADPKGNMMTSMYGIMPPRCVRVDLMTVSLVI